MSIWEQHFIDKSRRRSRRRTRELLMKAGVLILLFGSLAAAVYLRATGIR
jgi:hypothetical protein